MFYGSVSIICLTLAIRVESLTFSRSGRYIPNVKIAEEININDVTFTTPSTTDFDHVASLTSPKVVRTKPRVVVPAVNYHKVHHPSLKLLHGGGSVHYDKSHVLASHSPAVYALNWKNPKLKKWQVASFTNHGNYILAGHHGKVFAKPGKYRLVYPPRPVRPVYYLVGDDHAPTGNTDSDYRAPASYSGPNPEQVKLYNEKDLHFLKDKKNQYPKKYSPHTRTHEDETPVPDNSETSQSVGLTGDEKVTKSGERVEFQMYGMDGPNSYKFGYDTGKGDNRHFRFEERDKGGKVRGHYGYMDNEGKMRVMKYEADPELGFRAGPVDLPQEEEEEEDNS